MEAAMGKRHDGEIVGTDRTTITTTTATAATETETETLAGRMGAVAAPRPLRTAGLFGDDVRSDDGDGDGDGAAAANGMDSSIHSNKSVTTPPYWQNMHAHRRTASAQSSDSGHAAGAIRLLDNEADEEEDRNNACWAKSVEIVDYTVVNGGATSIGAFVVWNVRVETLHVCDDNDAETGADRKAC